MAFATSQSVVTSKFVVSSKGSFIAFAYNKSIKIVDSSNGSTKKTIDSGAVDALALSPDDKNLFSATHGSEIKAWDLGTLECKAWEYHNGHDVMAMTCNLSGKLLATAGADKKVLIWDVERGVCTQYFTGHKGVVTSVMFHPDRSLLFSASHDTNLRVWDLEEKKCVGVLTNHTSAVSSMAVTKDGWTLLSVGRDKAVISWDLHNYYSKSIIRTADVLEAVCIVYSGNPFASLLSAKKRRSRSNCFITVGNTDDERGIVRLWKGEDCLYVHKSSESTTNFTSATMLPPDQGLLCVTADQQLLLYSPAEHVEEGSFLKLTKRLDGFNDEEEQYLVVATNVEQRVVPQLKITCERQKHLDLLIGLVNFSYSNIFRESESTFVLYKDEDQAAITYNNTEIIKSSIVAKARCVVKAQSISLDNSYKSVLVLEEHFWDLDYWLEIKMNDFQTNNFKGIFFHNDIGFKKRWWKFICDDFKKIFREVIQGIIHLYEHVSFHGLFKVLVLQSNGTVKGIKLLPRFEVNQLVQRDVTLIDELRSLMRKIIKARFDDDDNHNQFGLPDDLLSAFEFLDANKLDDLPVKWLINSPFYWTSLEGVRFLDKINELFRAGRLSREFDRDIVNLNPFPLMYISDVILNDFVHHVKNQDIHWIGEVTRPMHTTFYKIYNYRGAGAIHRSNTRLGYHTWLDQATFGHNFIKHYNNHGNVSKMKEDIEKEMRCKLPLIYTQIISLFYLYSLCNLWEDDKEFVLEQLFSCFKTS